MYLSTISFCFQSYLTVLYLASSVVFIDFGNFYKVTEKTTIYTKQKLVLAVLQDHDTHKIVYGTMESYPQYIHKKTSKTHSKNSRKPYYIVTSKNLRRQKIKINCAIYTVPLLNYAQVRKSKLTVGIIWNIEKVFFSKCSIRWDGVWSIQSCFIWKQK